MTPTMSVSAGVYQPSGPILNTPAPTRTTQRQREHERSKLLSLYETGHYSDLRLNCNKRSFEVHRNILCPQIPYLEKEVGSSKRAMGVHTQLTFAEADNAEAVEVLLRFIYIGEIELPRGCADHTQALELLQDLKELATRYKIRTLLDVFEAQASAAYFEASARNLAASVEATQQAVTVTRDGRQTGPEGVQAPCSKRVTARCLELLQGDSR